MKNQLTLMHFDSKEELLSGIDTLLHYNIVIHEIHTPVPIPTLKTKLNIKQLRLGYAVLKFGCPGAIAFTTLICELFARGHINLFNLSFIVVAFLLATRLFPGQAPQLFKLKAGDNRYLVVVDLKNISVNKTITQLFQYAGAVEFSPAVKNIIIS
jgi:hypothetical protein